MNNDSINILIVGNGAVASALAKKLNEYENTGKIFITDSCEYKTEYYECADIRDDDITSLLKFALENEITLTIPISKRAFKSDIVEFFQSNGQNIFAPSRKTCSFFLNKANCQKFLYKNKAQCPKFAIFSKYSQAIDYLTTAAFPLIITQTEQSAQEQNTICTTIKQAQSYLDRIFANGETDVLIQEFPYGTNCTYYFISDGYSAIPFGSVRNFKFTNADKSGQYTDGIGCYSPEYRINETVSERIKGLAEKIINNFEFNSCAYLGIIGLECTLTDDDRFVVQNIKPFLQEHDARAILNLCEDNILNVINSCINGYFSDEYEQIKTNNCSSVSVKINTSLIDIKNTNDYDIDFCNTYLNGNNVYSSSLILTKTAPTLTRAKHKISQTIEEFEYKDIKYRKDICDKINT